MKEIKEQLGRMETMLEKVAVNTAQNSKKIDSLNGRVDSLGGKLDELQKEVKNNKLELLDKLATKDTVDAHELRITNIEEKVFN